MRRHRLGLLVALGIGIGGCTCAGQGLRGQATLVVDTGAMQQADTLDFGSVHVGQKKSLTAVIQNVGILDVTPTLSALASPFSVAPAAGLPVVAANGSLKLTVTFSPTTAADFTDALTVGCLGCDDTVVTLLGHSGGDCVLVVTPPALTFPLLQQGKSKILSSLIANTGAAACTVTMKLDSASDPAFALGGGATTVKLMPSGAGAKVVVTFAAPAVLGGHHGAVLVDSNDPLRPHQKILLNASDEDAGYADTPWPKWHRTSGNSGLSPVDTTRTTGTLAWKHQIGNAALNVDATATYIASPVIGLNDVIYQAGFGNDFQSPGSLTALNADGSQKWQVSITSPEATCAESTPTVAKDGSLYFMTGGDGVSARDGSASDEFFHLSAADGRTLWSTKNNADGYDSSPALAPDGTLYVIFDDGKTVQAYKNDKLQWSGKVSLGWPETFSGALTADGTSFWSGQGEVSSLTANGQQERWHVGLGFSTGTRGRDQAGKASPALGSDGTVYVAEAGLSFDPVNPDQVTVFALDPATGSTKWSAVGSGSPLNGGFEANLGGVDLSGYSSPALTPDGGIVVGGPAGMHAFAAGKETWHFSCGSVVSSPAVGADGSVYFGSIDGNLYALNATGKLRWKLAIGAPVNSSPAIGGTGTIYVTADDGFLYAVK